MDESGNYHSQQTATRTDNQTWHILTHRQVLNNENTWTRVGKNHTLGSFVGLGEGSRQVGGWGVITWGERPDIGDVGMEAANLIATCVPM